MRIDYSKKIFNAIQYYLNDIEMEFVFDEGVFDLGEISFAGAYDVYDMCIKIGECSFTASLNVINASDETVIPALSEFLMIVNSELTFGTFLLDNINGAVCLTYTHYCGNVAPLQEHIGCVLATLQSTITYCDTQIYNVIERKKSIMEAVLSIDFPNIK